MSLVYKKFILALLLVLCAPILKAQPLQVVSSFSILADLVEQVGGDHVQVYTLMKPDMDTHSFEPSAQDIRHLLGARLVFVNGLGFEPWLERLSHMAEFQGVMVAVSDGVTPLEAGGSDHEEDDHQHGEYDPHAWQDVSNVIIYIQNIANALAHADPIHAVDYQERAAHYIEELKILEADIFNTIRQIPPKRRLLVTTHDSFTYFSKRYGLTALSALGVANEALASAAGMAKLIHQVRDLQIPALFLENSSNPRILEQVARETHAISGGKLYADALSHKSSQSDTYIKMMRTNLWVLCSALCLK